MIVLGIETTCDETAAAVVERYADGRGKILSNIILSQVSEHAAFGGVVPEIAARAHVEALDLIIAKAMAEAECAYDQIDGIAAAAGPGLIGGVIVGLTTAKAIALVKSKPLIAVNHLEAHALTARLTDDTPFPYCLFLASGGHTQIVAVRGVGDYVRLGTTHGRRHRRGLRQDRETARPRLSWRPASREGSRSAATPRASRCRGRCMAARMPTSRSPVSKPRCAWKPKRSRRCRIRTSPICAPRSSRRWSTSCSTACAPACACSARKYGAPTALVAAGGVAANQAIRKVLHRLAFEVGTVLVAPPLELCTDNGAMIAWAGCERLALGLTDTLDVAPRARWPLDEVAAAQRPTAAHGGIQMSIHEHQPCSAAAPGERRWRKPARAPGAT